MDIDIDVSNRLKFISVLDGATQASIIKHNILKPHPSGVYFQDIPQTSDGVAGIDYEFAEDVGYLKIDLLNNSLYDDVKSNAHLDKLLSEEVDWDLFNYEEIVNQLQHLRDHFDIVKLISPRSIDDLAIVLALIRPGKAYLRNQSMNIIKDNIWKKEDTYYFKKSHAYAYAHTIIVKLHLLLEEVE